MAKAYSAFLDACDRFGGIDSVMVLTNGEVVAERWWPPAGPDVPHVFWSVSKSFTSAAVGCAVSEGLLSVSDHIVDLLPDDAPDRPSDNLAAMTVRDLLTMTSGHASESLPDDDRQQDVDWVRHILAEPVPHAPGTQFVYNSGATYLLSAILQRLTGQRLLDYLTPQLFEPLGVRDATWEQSPQGIDCGGWGLSSTTETIAKFGQLYLQHGSWDGRQLIPAEWVTASTSRQVPNDIPDAPPDWSQGYGYFFWQCRHGAYRGDGKDGQFCIVLPEHQTVVAMTANVTDMQAELELVWDTLLPELD